MADVAFPPPAEHQEAGRRLRACWERAGRAPTADTWDDSDFDDWVSGEWIGRYEFDRARGIDHETSLRKHEDELCDALGIARPERPNQPVSDVGTESGRVRADGLILRTASGAPWFGLGVSAFPLLKIWIEQGEPGVRVFVDWMIANGIGVARAFGMFNGGLGRFIPGEYSGRYFTGVATLGTYLRDRGVRLKLSVFADAQTDPLKSIRQREFFTAVAAVYVDTHLLDGGNEAFKNGWDPQALPRPHSILCSRGSEGGDMLPPVNPWDFFDVHPDRGDGWVKGGKSIYDVQIGNTSAGIALPAPGGIDEGIGIGEQDEPGKTTANADDCAGFAACTKLFGDFLILHIRSGVTKLEPPGPRAQACVEASVAACLAIPDDARLGFYTRGGLPDCPIEHDDAQALRTYARITRRARGSRAVCVALRPSATWRARAVNGWQIVDEPGRGIVLVEQ